ncbi:MAG: hypothetical protein M3P50_11070 [Actinomycetota bacterium]|nr:hypothetical protein [Actinomycetota bacterium]
MATTRSEYDAPLAALRREGVDVFAAYEQLAVEDVGAAADVLRPVYEETGALDGTPASRSRNGIDAFEVAMARLLGSIERRHG